MPPGAEADIYYDSRDDDSVDGFDCRSLVAPGRPTWRTGDYCPATADGSSGPVAGRALV